MTIYIEETLLVTKKDRVLTRIRKCMKIFEDIEKVVADGRLTTHLLFFWPKIGFRKDRENEKSISG